MKKKLITTSLLLCLTLSACGSTGETSANNNNAAQQEENSSQIQATNDEETETSQANSGNKQVDFKEMTVVDNENCVIRLTSIEPNGIWGYELKTYLENKSTDKTYMFAVDSASINGVQCEPAFATEVASGKKSNTEISFSDSTLENNGITDFTDIKLSFRVYDSNDWSTDDVANETVHIYPFGEENATKYVRESQDSDNIIIDNEYVTVTVIGYEKNDVWGYMANLFLQNKTDKKVMFSADEVSINGYMIDPFWAYSVSPDNCAFNPISWNTTDLESNGVSEVNEIQFKLKAYDENGDDVFVDETITLNPQTNSQNTSTKEDISLGDQSEFTDLSGTWQSENNDGSYQEAVISGDTIEINWITDDGKTKSIYWIGTYTAPTEIVDTYEWTSERDKEKTDSALLASTDDTKVISYSNGKLSYEVSAMGTTTTLELTKQ